MHRATGTAGAIAALLALAIVAACGSGGGGQTTDPGKPSQPSRPDSASAPAFTEKNVKLQPDLTVVERKGKAVVEKISDNGSGYTLDGSAPGVDKITEGKVLLVKNEVVGRVKKVERTGDDVHVTLGKVELGEIITDGEHSWNDLKPDTTRTKMLAYNDPKAITSGKDGDSAETQAEVEGSSTGDASVGGAVHAQNAAYQLAGPGASYSQQVKIGHLTVGVEYKPVPTGFEATLEVNDKVPAVEFGGQFILKMNKIATSGRIGFSEGKVDGATFQFNYTGALEMKWVAGKDSPGAFQYNNIVNIPLDFYLPLPTPSGITLLFFTKFKILLQPAVTSGGTALQMKANAVFNAQGGPSGGSFNVDSPTTAEAIKGVSLGVSGFVVALRPRIGVGVGIGEIAPQTTKSTYTPKIKICKPD